MNHNQSITLSISNDDKSQLEALALEFGITWGKRANISKLVEAIAIGKLAISPNNDWSAERIDTLKRAMDVLTNGGQIDRAQIIGELLLSRSELSPLLRTEIENFLVNLRSPFRSLIENFILQHQPFQLSYQDAAGRLWNFTVCYAKISIHEKRHYLNCWCQETEGNTEIAELAHNWCFHFDRLKDAAVSPINAQWQPGLDEIDVEMHLMEGAAFTYENSPEDVTTNWLLDGQRVRQVVRRVSNTSWFVQEVIRYAPDCVVISPESVRLRIRDKLVQTCQRYNLE